MMPLLTTHQDTRYAGATQLLVFHRTTDMQIYDLQADKVITKATSYLWQRRRSFGISCGEAPHWDHPKLQVCSNSTRTPPQMSKLQQIPKCCRIQSWKEHRCRSDYGLTSEDGGRAHGSKAQCRQQSPKAPEHPLLSEIKILRVLSSSQPRTMPFGLAEGTWSRTPQNPAKPIFLLKREGQRFSSLDQNVDGHRDDTREHDSETEPDRWLRSFLRESKLPKREALTRNVKVRKKCTTWFQKELPYHNKKHFRNFFATPQHYQSFQNTLGASGLEQISRSELPRWMILRAKLQSMRGILFVCTGRHK